MRVSVQMIYAPVVSYVETDVLEESCVVNILRQEEVSFMLNTKLNLLFYFTYLVRQIDKTVLISIFECRGKGSIF